MPLTTWMITPYDHGILTSSSFCKMAAVMRCTTYSYSKNGNSHEALIPSNMPVLIMYGQIVVQIMFFLFIFISIRSESMRPTEAYLDAE